MEKRVLNYRSYYNFTEAWVDDLHPTHNQNISGNYYPINSAILLKDEVAQKQFTVMNDRAQGGASLVAGRIELM